MKIFINSEMNSKFIVVREIIIKNTPQMIRIQNDYMIQTFPFNTYGYSFNITVFPRCDSGEIQR